MIYPKIIVTFLIFLSSKGQQHIMRKEVYLAKRESNSCSVTDGNDISDGMWLGMKEFL